MEPNFKEDITHVDILQHLIDAYEYKSYLEIGVQGKVCWNQIDCTNKIGVEPTGDMFDDRIKSITSDQFFAQNDTMFDIIFIDGDHDESQVSRDIDNALKFLKTGGAIVLHDAYPPAKEFTVSYRCGTVYRSIWNIRRLKNIGIVTYTGDFGVSVLRIKPAIGLYHTDVGTYEDYIKHSDELINKCDSFSDFKNKISVLFNDD